MIVIKAKPSCPPLIVYSARTRNKYTTWDGLKYTCHAPHWLYLTISKVSCDLIVSFEFTVCMPASKGARVCKIYFCSSGHNFIAHNYIATYIKAVAEIMISSMHMWTSVDS